MPLGMRRADHLDDRADYFCKKIKPPHEIGSHARLKWETTTEKETGTCSRSYQAAFWPLRWSSAHRPRHPPPVAWTPFDTFATSPAAKGEASSRCAKATESSRHVTGSRSPRRPVGRSNPAGSNRGCVAIEPAEHRTAAKTGQSDDTARTLAGGPLRQPRPGPVGAMDLIP